MHNFIYYFTELVYNCLITGKMEEIREDRIGSVLAWLQSGARGKASRMQFKKLQDQKLALYSCQRAIKTFMIAKTWLWMQIWLAIKPNLKCTQFGKYKKEYEDKIVSLAGRKFFSSKNQNLSINIKLETFCLNL